MSGFHSQLNKRLLFFGVLVFLSRFGSAQIEVTASDRLPVKGNINFGVNAVPILQWAGNLFNGNLDNNSIGNPKFRNPATPSIQIKYALTNKTFLRMTYGGNSVNQVQENLVFDDSKVNDPNAKVMDVRTSNGKFWGIALGIERRRNNGNLQGFFGGDILYGRIRNDEYYKYGNSFGKFNQTPTTTTDFNGRLTNNVGKRVISNIAQNSHEIGLRVFIGAEYFFTKAISIGAEFGYTMAYQNALSAQNTYEIFDTFDESVQQRTESVGGTSSTMTLLDNQGGSIMLNFYF